MDIEQVLKNFKTDIDSMELVEFELWFGFNTDTFLKELIKKISLETLFSLLLTLFIIVIDNDGS